MYIKQLNPKLDRFPFYAVFRVLSQFDRIIYRLYQKGMPPDDIAMLVNSTEHIVNIKIRRIKRLLSEYTIVHTDLSNEGVIS